MAAGSQAAGNDGKLQSNRPGAGGGAGPGRGQDTHLRKSSIWTTAGAIFSTTSAMKLNLYRGLVSWWRPTLAARTKGVSETCWLPAAPRSRVEEALLETHVQTQSQCEHALYPITQKWRGTHTLGIVVPALENG